MTNTNCLEGLRCPSCGADDAFYIVAAIEVLVGDDGTEDQGGDYIWDKDHPCRCAACGHHGLVRDFTVENRSVTNDLLAAAELVIARLSEGDLAEAVRGLDDAIARAKAFLSPRATGA
jgi:hypothetical protein